jgi:hypothetical protein
MRPKTPLAVENGVGKLAAWKGAKRQRGKESMVKMRNRGMVLSRTNSRIARAAKPVRRKSMKVERKRLIPIRSVSREKTPDVL